MAEENITELNEENFDAETRGGIVVVFIYNGSAPGDQRSLLGPASGHRYPDDVRFYAIDAARFPEIPGRFDIKKLPAAVFLRNGILKNTLEGVADAQQLVAASEQNACYTCPITRSRTEERKNRRSGRRYRR